MACKVTLLCFSIILLVFFHFVCGQNHEDIDKDNSVILPPCAACTTLVNSFLSKLKGYDRLKPVPLPDPISFSLPFGPG